MHRTLAEPDRRLPSAGAGEWTRRGAARRGASVRAGRSPPAPQPAQTLVLVFLWTAALLAPRALQATQAFDTTSHPVTWLGQHCITLDERVETAPDLVSRCSVNRFEPLGEVGGQSLYYGLYRFLVWLPEDLADTSRYVLEPDHPFNHTAAALFAGRPGGALAASFWAEATEFALAYFEPPKLIESPAGRVLMVPLRITGSASANDDRYFLHDGGGWVRLDTQAWLEDLAQRLPEGHAVWKGIVLDFERMRAESPVWREGDANCCPTGGWVDVEFALEGRTLTIARFAFRPEAPAPPPDR